jgi:hypothetical protein
MLRLIYCCLLMATPTKMTLNITTSQPNNVYHAGEPVHLKVSNAPANPTAVSFQITNFDGQTVISKTFDAQGIATVPPLPNGYYRVTAADEDHNSGFTYIAVLPFIAQYKGSIIATDAADCWLVQPPYFEDMAGLLQKAGFNRVRERLSWGEVEPSRGVFDWGKYDACVDAEHQHGIRVDQIFHSIPAWARADHQTNRYPDDLRDVYYFAKKAAMHYHGIISSWEIWNEPDIGFSVDSAADYAAFMKAATLGFKAGDPSVKISQAAMAMGASPYEESLYRNDTQAYFDIYNYHIYANPMDYPTRAQGHFDLLDKYHVPTKPVWITEAGIPLTAPNNTLTLQQMKTQAEFIPKSYAMSFASGTTKHFFFVFPHYMENGVEFGTFNQDRIPYAGYCALATLNRLIGGMHYAGEGVFKSLPDVQAHLFTDGSKDVWILWATKNEVNFNEDLESKVVHIYDCVGEKMPISDGNLPIKLTESPIYLVTKHHAIKTEMRRYLVSRKYASVGNSKPSPIVLRLLPPFSDYHRDGEEYLFPAGKWIPVKLQAYNFSNHKTTVVLKTSLPKEWKIKSVPKTLEIPPMGLEERSLQILPAGNSIAPRMEFRLRAIPAKLNADNTKSIATLNVALNVASITPVEVTPFASADTWTDSTSSNGYMTHTTSPDGSVHFDIHFDHPGDRWAYPQMIFKKPRDWSKYQALSFEYKTVVNDPKLRVRLMIQTPSGSNYFTSDGFPPSDVWRSEIVLFNTLVWGSFSPVDPNGKLNLKTIKSLLIGCNTSADHVLLEVRNLKLVRYHNK